MTDLQKAAAAIIAYEADILQSFSNRGIMETARLRRAFHELKAQLAADEHLHLTQEGARTATSRR